METIGLIVFVVVVVGGYVWLLAADEVDQRLVRKEMWMSRESERIRIEEEDVRRLRYIKLYWSGGLFEIMTEQQVDDLLDDVYGE